MALPVWVTWLANIKGPPGPPGPPIPPDQIEDAVAEQLPPLIDAEIDSRHLVDQSNLDGRVDGLVDELDLVATRIVSASGGSWTDLDLVDASLAVALDVRSTALNRPVSNGWYWRGWHAPTVNSAAVQFLTSVSSPPQTYVRTRTGGAWTPWLRITDQGVLDARVAGLPEELHLVQLVKCIRLVSGRWFWDGPGVAASTHFVVRRDGRWATAAAPLPQPSATAPAITW